MNTGTMDFGIKERLQMNVENTIDLCRLKEMLLYQKEKTQRN